MAVCFTNEEDKRKFDILSEIVGENAAMADVVRHNGLVRSPRAVIQDLENEFTKPADLNIESKVYDDTSDLELSEKDIRSSFEQIFARTNSENSQKAIQDFSTRLNVPVVFYENKPGSKINAFYSKGTVYFADGFYSSDNVFHEFAHPVVKILAKDNAELFDKLYNDLINTDKGQAIYDRVVRDYENNYEKDSQEFKEEIVVQALTEANAEEIKNRTVIGNIFYNIKKILRKFFGKSIDLSNLSGKTKLKDFVTMINMDTINLDTDFLSVDDVVYLMKEYDVEMKAINQQVKEEFQALINDLAETIENQSVYLKNQNAISPIYADLTNDDANGLIDNMNLILRQMAGKTIPESLSKSKLVSELTESQILTNEQIANRLNTFISQVLKIEKIADILNDRFVELRNKNLDSLSDIKQLFTISEILEQYLYYLEKAGINRAEYPNLITSELTTKLSEIKFKVDQLYAAVNEKKISSTIDVLYDHIQETSDKGQSFYENELRVLKESGTDQEYVRAHTEYYGLTPEELSEFNALEAKSSLNTTERNRRLELLNKKIKGFSITREEFKELFFAPEARAGILKMLNNSLESYLYNQDTIVGSFSSFLKKYLDEVNLKSNARQAELLADNKLNDLLKAAGWGTRRHLNSPKLGRELGELVDVGQLNNKLELEENLEWQFKSAFKDFEGRLKFLKEKIKEASIAYVNEQTTDAKTALYEAQNELFFELKNNFVQKNVDSFYDVEALLYQDELGTKARMLMDDIYKELNYLGDPIDAISNSEIDKVRADKFAELIRLRSLLDENLNYKTGEDLLIAERLKEYFDRRKEFYESTVDAALFQAKYNEAVEDSKYEIDADGNQIPRSLEVQQELLNQWIDRNTTVSVSDEYYEERKYLLERREEILTPIKEENDKIVDLSEIYERVYEIIRMTRDESGQYNGYELTPDQQILLRDLQQAIEDSKKELYSVIGKGLTGNELEEFFELWNSYSEGYALESYEQDLLDSYLDTMREGLSVFGISEEDQKELIDIEKRLSEMSQSIFTIHYLNTFQQFYDSDPNFKEVMDEFLIKISDDDFNLDDNYIVQEKHIKELFKGYNESFLNELRGINSDFNTFIENNHIQIERQEEQPNGKNITVTIFRNTAVWQFSQPLDEDAYNTFSLQDEFGNDIELLRDRNNTLRIPGFNFQNREVKDAFRTEEIEKDFVDAQGNLVVANKNNKGQWLPKESSEYRNESYYDMFNNNRPMWDLLNYVKDWHLDNQKNKPNNKKLYISYPKLRKNGAEDYFTRGYWRRRAYRMGDMFRTRADDFDEGVRFDKRSGETFTSKTINEVDRPVIGVWEGLPLNELSTDIFETMQRYQHSLQEFEVANELFPYANTVQRTLSEFNSDGTLKNAKLKSSFVAVASKNKKDRNTAQVTSDIIDRYIRGIQLKTTSETYSVIGKWVDKASKWTSRKFFMLNPVAGIRNYASGQIQGLYLLWDFKNYVTPVDFVVGAAKANATLLHYQSRGYSAREKTAQMQLMDILNASPDKYLQMQADAGNRSILNDLVSFRIGYYIRTTLTHSFNYQSSYAFMNNKKFKFKLNGKSTTLDNAVEIVDGRIQTKEGVPEEFKIGYDESGNVVLGKKIKELIKTQEDYLLKTVGMAGRNNEGDFMSRTLIGKILFSMMKFIVPMSTYRYGTKIRYDKSAPVYQKVKLQRRRNWLTGGAERGYFIDALKIGLDIAESGYSGFRKRNIGYRQYVALAQLVSAVLMTELIRYTIGSLLTMNFTGLLSDDDDEEFTIDELGGRSGVEFKKWSDNVRLPDLPWVDDDVASKGFDLKEYSKLHLINLLIEVERENETFFAADYLHTISGYMTGSSPFFGGIPAELVRAFKFTADNSYLTEEEEIEEMLEGGRLYKVHKNRDKSLIGTDAGPYSWQKKGAWKIYNIIGRSYGFNGMILDPAAKIQSNLQYLPKDWEWAKTVEGGKE
jgi:DNA-binding transcriptional regulator YhcF (GntR family)